MAGTTNTYELQQLTAKLTKKDKFEQLCNDVVREVQQAQEDETRKLVAKVAKARDLQAAQDLIDRKAKAEQERKAREADAKEVEERAQAQAQQ